MNTATLGSIVAWGRDLAGLPVGGPFSADRWRKFANQGLSELHYILAESYADWLEATQSVALVADQTDYPLASTVYKPLSADYVSSDGQNYNIPRFMLSERNDRQAASGWIGSSSDYQMRIIGAVMRLQPAPNATGTVTLTYIPAHRDLAQDDEPVHQAIPQGWEEMAAYGAAMRGVGPLSPEYAELKGMRDELGQRFTGYASDRHAGEPGRVNDRRGSSARRLLYGY